MEQAIQDDRRRISELQSALQQRTQERNMRQNHLQTLLSSLDKFYSGHSFLESREHERVMDARWRVTNTRIQKYVNALGVEIVQDAQSIIFIFTKISPTHPDKPFSLSMTLTETGTYKGLF